MREGVELTGMMNQTGQLPIQNKEDKQVLTHQFTKERHLQPSIFYILTDNVIKNVKYEDGPEIFKSHSLVKRTNIIKKANKLYRKDEDIL